ncbi:hypothetical protein GGR32_001207 [Mesonia hippocampi]|uniref:Secreted protein n=1 Tax=Mesonia hippocampi TaxID=1628250 RepID=A0A840ETY4_9FLAO|nr:hypothetical protein [Mesonia hippocampi]MBB4118916.1 hypothetical protein [Mesonia hippocampi]
MKQITHLLVAISVFTISFSGFSQGESAAKDMLNNYKNVVVPIEFKLLSEKNQYLLNSLTKHLLSQKGFTTYMDVEVRKGEVPEIRLNPCSALYASLEGTEVTMFSFVTKVKLVLKNCHEEVVYETGFGSSREKDYKEAYQEALRKAFADLENTAYEYNGSNGLQINTSVAVVEKNDHKNSEAAQLPVKSKTLEALAGRKYRYNNQTYTLRKIEAGFILEEGENQKRYAFISPTDGDFLYNSESINGTLKITTNNNLKVTYFDTAIGKLQHIIYGLMAD